ncbi:MAG: hypothetical protein BZY79_06020 [SAR202 cluster bacterium Casp-Chloro-G4]|nr:MAG: hypothetical protein BZY79_06020 [SAR202 cluster bacterium Casp-Chloro-G4]
MYQFEDFLPPPVNIDIHEALVKSQQPNNGTFKVQVHLTLRPSMLVTDVSELWLQIADVEFPAIGVSYPLKLMGTGRNHVSFTVPAYAMTNAMDNETKEYSARIRARADGRDTYTELFRITDPRPSPSPPHAQSEEDKKGSPQLTAPKLNLTNPELGMHKCRPMFDAILSVDTPFSVPSVTVYAACPSIASLSLFKLEPFVFTTQRVTEDGIYETIESASGDYNVRIITEIREPVNVEVLLGDEVVISKIFR